jgi:hypothetical protein
MAATYEPITTQTLSSTAASITFSSIPATYTDLFIVLVFTTTVANQDTSLQFNGDTATNYSRTVMSGSGAAATSANQSSVAQIQMGNNNFSSTTIPQMISLNVMSYAASIYKSVLSSVAGDKNGSGVVERSIGLWRSTSAITSISLISKGSFAIGTTATLYGIKAA